MLTYMVFCLSMKRRQCNEPSLRDRSLESETAYTPGALDGTGVPQGTVPRRDRPTALKSAVGANGIRILCPLDSNVAQYLGRRHVATSAFEMSS